MAANNKQQNELNALFGKYNQRLGKLYQKFIKELSTLGVRVEDKLTEDALFMFDNFPELKSKLNEIFTKYVEDNMQLAKGGIQSGVALAFGQDALNLHGYTVLNDAAISQVRSMAVQAFTARRMKVAAGLSLSQKVWNYSQQTKSEFEMAVSNVLTDGLQAGTCAAELSRRVRQQLNDPEMMYRRYHHKVVTKGGKAKDVVKWHRRVVDENGKVRFIEAPLEEVGQGTYRSSYKNSFRLMRTEINMAYHYANNARWLAEPFVIGIRIWGSPQHPRPDICDELWGNYPKDFMFAGFHPQCMCAAAAITCTREEIKEYLRRKRAGEDVSNFPFEGIVRDVPNNFKKYVANHHDAILKAGKKGTLAYIFRDNAKYLRSAFSSSELEQMGLKAFTKRIKTAAERAEIQRRWDERKRRNAAQAVIDSRHANRDAAAVQKKWNEYQLERVQRAIAEAKLTSTSPVLDARLAVLRTAIQKGATAEISAAYRNALAGIKTQLAREARHAARDPKAIQKAWNNWHYTRAEKALAESGVQMNAALATRMKKLRNIAKMGNVKGIATAYYRVMKAIEVQAAWDAHTIKYATQLVFDAQKVGYKDIMPTMDALRDKLLVKDLAQVRTLARQLGTEITQVEDAVAKFKYVQDAKLHLKNVSLADLQVVEQKVAEKVVWVESKFPNNLLKHADKYNWEAYDYLGANMNGVQQKFPNTWNISQQAYIKLAEATKIKYEWSVVEQQLQELKAYYTSSASGSAKLKAHISGIDALLSAKGDLAAAQQAVKDAEKYKKSLESSAKYRAKKSVKKSPATVVPAGAKTLADVPLEEAMKLISDFEANFTDSADANLRPLIEYIWRNNLTAEERLVLTKYTQTYSYLNEPLREIRYKGGRLWQEFEADMPTLTSALSKMEMPANTVVRRGTDDYTIKALGKRLSDVQVGDEFVDGAFLSTSVRKDRGFFESLDLTIVVPKGAQGVYAEPFTHYNGEGYDFGLYGGTPNLWNGIAKAAFGREREWIGQRGCKFRVIKKEGHKIYLQMIGQLYDQTTDYKSFF